MNPGPEEVERPGRPISRTFSCRSFGDPLKNPRLAGVDWLGPLAAGRSAYKAQFNTAYEAQGLGL
jgi:hypothetical protein